MSDTFDPNEIFRALGERTAAARQPKAAPVDPFVNAFGVDAGFNAQPAQPRGQQGGVDLSALRALESIQRLDNREARAAERQAKAAERQAKKDAPEELVAETARRLGIPVEDYKAQANKISLGIKPSTVAPEIDLTKDWGAVTASPEYDRLDWAAKNEQRKLWVDANVAELKARMEQRTGKPLKANDPELAKIRKTIESTTQIGLGKRPVREWGDSDIIDTAAANVQSWWSGRKLRDATSDEERQKILSEIAAQKADHESKLSAFTIDEQKRMVRMRQKKIQENVAQGLPPELTMAQEASMGWEGFKSDPYKAVLGNLPTTLASVGASLAGGLAGGVPGAVAAGAAVGQELTSAFVAKSIADEISGLSPQDLAKSPKYQELLQFHGGDAAKAKAAFTGLLVEDSENTARAFGAVTSAPEALIGAGGIARQAVGRIAGPAGTSVVARTMARFGLPSKSSAIGKTAEALTKSTAQQGLIKSAGVAARPLAAEAGQEFFQEGGETVIGNVAQQRGGLDTGTFTGAVEAGVSGALTGAATAGGFKAGGVVAEKAFGPVSDSGDAVVLQNDKGALRPARSAKQAEQSNLAMDRETGLTRLRDMDTQTDPNAGSLMFQLNAPLITNLARQDGASDSAALLAAHGVNSILLAQPLGTRVLVGNQAVNFLTGADGKVSVATPAQLTPETQAAVDEANRIIETLAPAVTRFASRANGYEAAVQQASVVSTQQPAVVSAPQPVPPVAPSVVSTQQPVPPAITAAQPTTTTAGALTGGLPTGAPGFTAPLTIQPPGAPNAPQIPSTTQVPVGNGPQTGPQIREGNAQGQAPAGEGQAQAQVTAAPGALAPYQDALAAAQAELQNAPPGTGVFDAAARRVAALQGAIADIGQGRQPDAALLAPPSPPLTAANPGVTNALAAFDRALNNVPPPFTAVSASGTRSLAPKPISQANKTLLRNIMQTLLIAGMPTQIVASLTAAGQTGQSAQASVATSVGWLLLGSKWAGESDTIKRAIVAHELGHLVDSDGIGTESGLISGTSAWDAAHQQLEAWYNSRRETVLGYPFDRITYSKMDAFTVRKESYAQAVRLYFTSPVALQQNAPAAFDAIAARLDQLNGNTNVTATTSPTITNPSRPSAGAEDTGATAAGGPVVGSVPPAELGGSDAGAQPDAQQVTESQTQDDLTVQDTPLGRFYTDPNGVELAVMENARFAPRDNSITHFVVPEEARGRGLGRSMLAKILARYPKTEVSASASSAASVALLYEQGFRPISEPTATLEQTQAKRIEDSSVTMVVPPETVSESQPAPRSAQELRNEADALREQVAQSIERGTATPAEVRDAQQRIADLLDQASELGMRVGDTIDVDGTERPTRNSNGQPIANNPESIRNFWRWFGDSKVVDEQGRPKTLYHTTTKDFDAFVPGGTVPTDSGRAVWLAPDPSATLVAFRVGSLQRGFREGARMLPVYAKVNRPLVVDTPGTYDWVRSVYGGEMFPQLISEQALQDMQQDGYDGVFFQGEALGWGKGSDETIVFKPTQIKSATGNRGTFDPIVENINESQRAPGDFQIGQPALPATDVRGITQALSSPGLSTAARVKKAAPFLASIGDWILEQVADGLIPTVRWIESLPVAPVLKEALRGAMYLAPNRRDALLERAQVEAGGEDLQLALQKMHTDLLKRVPGVTIEDVIQDAGYWATAVYAKIKNQRMLESDQDAATLAQGQWQAAVAAGAPQAEIDQLEAEFNRLEKIFTDRQFALAQPATVNTHVGQGADPLPVGLAGGFNNAKADEVIAAAERRFGKPALEAMAKNLYKLNAFRMATDITSGRTDPAQAAAFSPEIAALMPEMMRLFNASRTPGVRQNELDAARTDFVNKLAATSKYVPTTGDPDKGFEADVLGSGFKTPNVAKDRRLQGRTTSLAQDGITATLGGMQRSASAAGWNDFTALIEQAYNSMSEAEREAVGMKKVPVTALDRLGDNLIIRNQADGTSVGYSIGDGRVLQALRKENVEDKSELMRIVEKPTQWFAKAATRWNLPFGPINAIRDVWERSENMRARNYTSATGKRVDSNKAATRMIAIARDPAVLRELAGYNWAISQGKALPTSRYAELQREFEEVGGGGSKYGVSIARERRNLVKEIADAEGGVIKKSYATFERYINFWNDTFDEVAPLAAYIALREQGMSKGAAGAAALDLMNFRKSGAFMPVVRALYAFAQPTVTGAVNLVNTLKTETGRKRMAGYVVALVALQAILASAGGDDEETGKSYWDSLDDFAKERSIPLPIPGSPGEFIKLPLGFGLPQVSNLIALRLRNGAIGEADVAETAEAILGDVVQTFTPLRASKIDDSPMRAFIQTFSPTVATPSVNVAINRGGLGQELVKEAFLDKAKYKAEQGAPLTAEFYKDTAQIIRGTFGMDFAPEEVKELMNTFSLGLLRNLQTAMVDNPNKELQGRPTTTPIIGSFVATTDNAPIREAKNFEREGLALARERNSNPEKEFSPEDQAKLELYDAWVELDKEFRKRGAALTRAGVAKGIDPERQALSEERRAAQGGLVRQFNEIQ